MHIRRFFVFLLLLSVIVQLIHAGKKVKTKRRRKLKTKAVKKKAKKEGKKEGNKESKKEGNNDSKKKQKDSKTDKKDKGNETAVVGISAVNGDAD